jgi:hypothetical protein
VENTVQLDEVFGMIIDFSALAEQLFNTYTINEDLFLSWSNPYGSSKNN